MMNSRITEQITRLEMMYSEQEYTIQSLNEIVARQTGEISDLKSELQALKLHYQELKSELPDQLNDIEKPPHY
ncbi:MAG: SlyX family protein [Gammaproteobacteria bacterium]|nr:SlyX family protein [Gammaproteobacteria bacterium]MCZ6796399.1 SlyX family protein [Gammaproteobacteria bacterium]